MVNNPTYFKSKEFFRYDPNKLGKIWSKLSDLDRSVFNNTSLFVKYIYGEVYYLVSTEKGLYFKGIKSGKLERLYADQQTKLLILKKALTKKEFKYLLKVGARGRNSFSKFSEADREQEIKHVEKKYTQLLKKDTERAIAKFMQYNNTYRGYLSKEIVKKFDKIIDKNPNLLLKLAANTQHISKPSRFPHPNTLANLSLQRLGQLMKRHQTDKKYINSIFEFAKKKDYHYLRALPSKNNTLFADKLLSENRKIDVYTIKFFSSLLTEEIIDKKYYRVFIKQIKLYSTYEIKNVKWDTSLDEILNNLNFALTVEGLNKKDKTYFLELAAETELYMSESTLKHLIDEGKIDKNSKVGKFILKKHRIYRRHRVRTRILHFIDTDNLIVNFILGIILIFVILWLLGRPLF